MLRSNTRHSMLIVALIASSAVLADGVSIDKVYDPYVQAQEKEIEYRALFEQDSNNAVDGRQRHKLGYGQSLSDRFFAELYVIGTDEQRDGFQVEAYEAELKWQLTEQGEFDNDWGLLFEVEKSRKDDIWEASSAVIAVHEWPKWILTGNLAVIYEWGDDIKDEWETAFAGQLRYRNVERFEPAIELYQAQGTQGIGPVLTGLLRPGAGQKFRWEVGAIFGLDSKTADTNWKLSVEYEFY